MRPVLLFIVLLCMTSACEKKEVSLSQIDILTGGNAKEWLIVENYFNGVNVTEEEPCYKDDTAIFSKGEGTEAKLIPVYIWKKNDSKCSGVDEDRHSYFYLADDFRTISFGDVDVSLENGDVWKITKLSNTEIIINQNTTNVVDGSILERRLRFVPLANSGASPVEI